MEPREVTVHFEKGYVVEYVFPNSTSDVCTSRLSLPGDNLWPTNIRIVLYMVFLLYLFIGVAIGSNVFMESIEFITSKNRTIVVWDEEKKKNVQMEVFIWNKTVANLTLLALGSSAPEILLAVVETMSSLFSDEPHGESLGFATIVGSASFNLLVITAICITGVQSPEVKKIEEFGVFLLTSASSLFAYLWLLIVLIWHSPGVVEPWEAFATLLYFPLLVLVAYAQDNGWWRDSRRNGREVAAEGRHKEDQPVINVIGSRRGSIGLHPVSLSEERGRKSHTTAVDHQHGSPSRTNQTMRKLSIVAPSDPRQMEMANNEPETINQSQMTRRPRRHYVRARWPIWFRHNVVRVMRGVKPSQNNKIKVERDNCQNPQFKLASVATRLARAWKLQSKNAIQDFPISLQKIDASCGSFSFAASTYCVHELAVELTIDVLLNRRNRAKQPMSVSRLNAANVHDTEIVAGALTVDYETREGSARVNKDFLFTSGTLVNLIFIFLFVWIFEEEDFVKTIAISIINDNQYHPNTDFYVILKNPSTNAFLGDPSVVRATIINDNNPGDFVLEKSQLYADMKEGEVQTTVLRQNGCDGNVQVCYSTIDGTAKGGSLTDDPDADFEHTNGMLEFKHQESSKVLTIRVNKNVKETKNFVLVLQNPSVGSRLGEHSAAVANLNLRPGDLNHLSRVLLEENDGSWWGQFVNATQAQGEVDECGCETPPSKLDYILHVFTILWKVLFACVPPKHIFGGILSFVVSLFFIGLITAIIEQTCHLLGCVARLNMTLTGLTIVALGTSLPDTIASRTAAIMDDTADASIGNIMGSNSVNVFLGLGLPWVIRVVYYEWKDEVYTVNTDNLQFYVTTFDSFGSVCVVGLIARRFLLGGELGGKMLTKWVSGAALLLMWMSFICLAVMRSFGVI